MGNRVRHTGGTQGREGDLKREEGSMILQNKIGSSETKNPITRQTTAMCETDMVVCF